MQIDCFKTLFFIIIWIVYSMQFVFCQEETHWRTGDIANRYYDGFDGIRRYGLLQAQGNYTKLKLIIRSKRKDYNSGDSVEVRFFIRNDSDSEVHIRSSSVCPFIHLWKLFYSNYDEVNKMPNWEAKFQNLTEKGHSGKYYERIWTTKGDLSYIKLQSGQEFEFARKIHLNDYFDLSKPDTYELTCFLPTIIIGQCYEPPLQSNTLTFRIVEEQADDVEDGMNPPKSEEVFKQAKPPKSVFYIWGLSSTPIDVSPAEYYRLPAEERQAHIIKLTEQP